MALVAEHLVAPPAGAAPDERRARLEQRGAELAGVRAAVAELVEVIAAALAEDLWQGYGIRSPEHWTTIRFSLAPGRARRLVAAARALERLPACRAASAPARSPRTTWPS